MASELLLRLLYCWWNSHALALLDAGPACLCAPSPGLGMASKFLTKPFSSSVPQAPLVSQAAPSVQTVLGPAWSPCEDSPMEMPLGLIAGHLGEVGMLPACCSSFTSIINGCWQPPLPRSNTALSQAVLLPALQHWLRGGKAVYYSSSTRWLSVPWIPCLRYLWWPVIMCEADIYG